MRRIKKGYNFTTHYDMPDLSHVCLLYCVWFWDFCRFFSFRFLLILLIGEPYVCDTEDWSLGYTAVSGGEEICIGGQRLRVIFAPVIFIDTFFVLFIESFFLRRLSFSDCFLLNGAGLASFYHKYTLNKEAIDGKYSYLLAQVTNW